MWQTLKQGNGYYRPARRGVEVMTVYTLGNQKLECISYGKTIRDALDAPATVKLIKQTGVNNGTALH